MDENQQLDEVIEPARANITGGQAEAEIEPSSIADGVNTLQLEPQVPTMPIAPEIPDKPSAWRYAFITLSTIQLGCLGILLLWLLPMGGWGILILLALSPWMMGALIIDFILVSVYLSKYKNDKVASVARAIILIFLALGCYVLFRTFILQG